MTQRRKLKVRVRPGKQQPTPTSTPTRRKRNLLQILRRRGWSVELAASVGKLLPATLAKRYPILPAGVEAFLTTLDICVSPNESAWFLTARDFARKRGSGFHWNEIELMMLEDAEGDPAQQAEVRSFWDGHFPVMLAVHSDYDYLAVRLSDGAVVHGFAPEWGSSKVARSFAALLTALATEAETQRDRYPWKLFVGKSCVEDDPGT